MEKQQKDAFTSKQLSRMEMKKLKGGATFFPAWVCVMDGYWGCYDLKVRCLMECPDYKRCIGYNSCP